MRRSIRAARGCRACRRPGARGRATLGPGRPQSSCGTRRRRLSGRFASSQCRPRRTAVIPGTSGAWATRSDRRWVGVRAGAAAGARVRTWPRAPRRTSPRPRCAQLEDVVRKAVPRALSSIARSSDCGCGVEANTDRSLGRIRTALVRNPLFYPSASSNPAVAATPGPHCGAQLYPTLFPVRCAAAKRPTGGPLCRS